MKYVVVIEIRKNNYVTHVSIDRKNSSEKVQLDS